MSKVRITSRQISTSSRFYAVFDKDIIEEVHTSYGKENLQYLYKIDDKFFCIICEKLLNNACQLECGCRACYECLKNYLDSQNNVCPSQSCHGIICAQLLPDKDIADEMLQVEHKCVNKSCPQTISLLKFYEHREECPFSFMKGQNCFSDVQLSMKDNHERYLSSANTRKASSQFYSFNDDEYQHPDIALKSGTKSLDFSSVKSLETQTTMTTEGIVEGFKDEIIDNQLKVSFDSHYVWKITHFARRKEETAQRRPSYIISPSFFTEAIGYKMCLKAYLNGNGEGQGSHLSVFVFLLPGPHDSLLEWPFSKTFSLELLNQGEGTNKIITFQAASESDCFSRPQSKQNIATGCPTFIELNALDDGYVMNDTMFIRFVIHYC